MFGKMLVKSSDFFPAGYKFKAIVLGDIWKGFSDNVIPICQDISGTGGTQHTGGGSTSWNGSTAVNGKIALNFGYSIGGLAQYNNIIMTSRSTGYSIFLPVFFNFDWDKIKSTVKSGTITCWLEKSGGGIKPLLKSSSIFLQKVVLTMLGRVLINQKSEYAGYKIMRGTKDIVSTSNDGVISRLIPQEIIPLTFKLEWSGTAKWYIHFAMQSTPIGWINGFIWSGGGKETCMTYMDVESLYGFEYLKKCKYFGGNATNATGTYKISIVKWLEKAGA